MLKKSWHIIVLVFLVVLFFSPIAAGKFFYYNGDFSGSDLLDFNYPVKKMMQDAYRSGEIPIWQDEVGAGFPMMFEGQMGFFYPLNYLVYNWVDMPLAFNLSIILHFLLAGLGMIFYLRFLKFNKALSLAGALAFALSGFFLAHSKHINLIAAAAWFPWSFYFLEKYIRKPRACWALFSALAVSMSALAGHLEIAYITGFSLGLYYFLRFAFSIKSKINSEKKQLLVFGKLSFNFLLYFILVILTVVSLNAAQLLPAWQLLQESWRNPQFFNSFAVFSYSARDLLSFLNPFVFGNPAEMTYGLFFRDSSLFWENLGYFGLLPLFFFFVGLAFFKKFTDRQKKEIFGSHFLQIIISFSLVFGSSSIVYAFAYVFVPGMNSFRVPNRFLLTVVFSAVVISIFGLDYFYNRLKPHIKKYAKLVNLFLVVFLLVVIVGDLAYFNYRYQSYVKTADWLAEPESATIIKNDAGYDNYRIYDFASMLSRAAAYRINSGWQDLDLFRKHQSVFRPNTNYLYNLDNLNAHSGLNLLRNTTLEGAFYLRKAFQQNWSAQFPIKREVFFNQAFNNYLSAGGVKYVLSYFEMDVPGLDLWQEVESADKFIPLKIYKNKNVLPKAWLVGGQEVYDDLSNLITNGLTAEDFNPRETVLLEEAPGVLLDNQVDGQVDVIYWKNGEIILSVDANQPAWLMISNSYYPDWYAWINGEKTYIYRADYLYQAVQVPAGKSVVELKFIPLWFYLGLLVSLVGFIILLLVAILMFKKYLWIRWKLNK